RATASPRLAMLGGIDSAETCRISGDQIPCKAPSLSSPVPAQPCRAQACPARPRPATPSVAAPCRAAPPPWLPVTKLCSPPTPYLLAHEGPRTSLSVVGYSERFDLESSISYRPTVSKTNETTSINSYGLHFVPGDYSLIPNEVESCPPPS